tara:strand:+ start:5319 stop:6695 length:1377 start_codon:yes stop_codon:yes gene_type:complete
MMFDKDTIAVISSPQGQGAISIIRVSGDKTHNAVEKIFRPKLKQKKYSDLKINKNYLGIIQHKDEIIDEVIISKLKKPNSFTGEDMVEIFCHGSTYIQNRIMELLSDRGIRTAKPGEFSLRSYVNGKMDLIQAEGISDLISSNSKASHKLAMNQVRGGVSNEIKKMRDELLNLSSLIELELDFSEEDVEFASRDKFLSLLNNVEEFISELVDSFKYGNAMKDGIPVSIVGSPNVGKSTLLNSILNEDKAITSPISGTTRDIIEDTFNIEGKLFRFIDTAGIRKTEDEIEKIGISRTLESINRSEIILYLIDLTSSDKNIDFEINESNKLKKKYKEKSIMLIFTKADLVKKQIKKTSLKKMLINTKEKKDVTYLKSKIIENLNQNFSNKLIITNSRHYSALSLAKKEINNVKKGLKNNVPSDLLTIDLKQVLYHLGEVTGEVTNEDILSNIFSKFCIGK